MKVVPAKGVGREGLIGEGPIRIPVAQNIGDTGLPVVLRAKTKDVQSEPCGRAKVGGVVYGGKELVSQLVGELT